MKLWENAEFMSVKCLIRKGWSGNQMGINEEHRMVKGVCFIIRCSSIFCSIGRIIVQAALASRPIIRLAYNL